MGRESNEQTIIEHESDGEGNFSVSVYQEDNDGNVSGTGIAGNTWEDSHIAPTPANDR